MFCVAARGTVWWYCSLLDLIWPRWRLMTRERSYQESNGQHKLVYELQRSAFFLESWCVGSSWRCIVNHTCVLLNWSVSLWMQPDTCSILVSCSFNIQQNSESWVFQDCKRKSLSPYWELLLELGQRYHKI